MTIKLLAIGKTDNKNLISLIGDYKKRLSFYVKFEIEIIPDLKKAKNLNEDQQKQKEGELILNKVNNIHIFPSKRTEFLLISSGFNYIVYYVIKIKALSTNTKYIFHENIFAKCWLNLINLI